MLDYHRKSTTPCRQGEKFPLRSWPRVHLGSGTECHLYRLSIIRYSLAACLLIHGCERSSIIAHNFVTQSEVDALSSRYVWLLTHGPGSEVFDSTSGGDYISEDRKSRILPISSRPSFLLSCGIWNATSTRYPASWPNFFIYLSLSRVSWKRLNLTTSLCGMWK